MPPKAATNSKATTGKGKAAANQVPKKLLVVLKVEKTKLAQFNTTNGTTSTTTKSPKLSAGSHTPRKSSPLAAGGVSVNDVVASPSTEQQDNTPAPSVAASVQGTDTPGTAAPAKAAPKRRAPGGGGAKPGRKKQRTDGTGINGGGSSTSHPKLGPKSNLGAINAHLRALDRSGTPCKKWSKKGFQLKSFTGVQWSLPKWATPAVEKSLNLPDSAQVTTETKGTKTEKENDKGKGKEKENENAKDKAVEKIEPTPAVTPNATGPEASATSEGALPVVDTPPAQDMDVKMVDAEPVAAAV